MAEDVDLRVVVTQLTERLAAQAERQAEAARVQNDRMAHLAQEVSSCAARVAAVAERMHSQYVPREVYTTFCKQNEAIHLDTQGDVAKTMAQLGEFRQEYRRDRETDRLEHAAEIRARKNLQWLVVGTVASGLIGLATVVIAVLALL